MGTARHLGPPRRTDDPAQLFRRPAGGAHVQPPAPAPLPVPLIERAISGCI